MSERDLGILAERLEARATVTGFVWGVMACAFVSGSTLLVLGAEREGVGLYLINLLCFAWLFARVNADVHARMDVTFWEVDRTIGSRP